jgi:V/A-type H+/Na+-transporting ATPase subunit C
MSEMQYTYAVARIRALETALFSATTMEQLIACQNEEQGIQFLIDKGWGEHDTPANADAILTREQEKIWEVIQELSVDMSVFDVLSYPVLFHNLKAAVKKVCTEAPAAHIFYEDCAIPGKEMLSIIQEKDFSRLPAYMAEAAEEAYETLLHTRDGQLCDIIIDKAALSAIYAAGRASEEEIIRAYAESTVAVADIKIAVRSQKTAKSIDFMKRAMAACESLSVDSLIKAAVAGQETIQEYLSDTVYGEGGKALADSPAAFERWCDNRIIHTIQPQKYNPFSAGPLFAYILARENEIKTVRIVLSGKQNDLPDDSIRERVRDMYV